MLIYSLHCSNPKAVTVSCLFYTLSYKMNFLGVYLLCQNSNKEKKENLPPQKKTRCLKIISYFNKLEY